MIDQAFIYRRTPQWPIVTALGTALLVHLSAVAIAFHREPITQPTPSDLMIVPSTAKTPNLHHRIPKF